MKFCLKFIGPFGFCVFKLNNVYDVTTSKKLSAKNPKKCVRKYNNHKEKLPQHCMLIIKVSLKFDHHKKRKTRPKKYCKKFLPKSRAEYCKIINIIAVRRNKKYL